MITNKATIVVKATIAVYGGGVCPLHSNSLNEVVKSDWCAISYSPGVRSRLGASAIDSNGLFTGAIQTRCVLDYSSLNHLVCCSVV
jgi:hypothetical protein